MIDEFQEFFTEEDRVSQSAAVLLDRIVRQGRAFGIHVILGSQTLGGAYTLARATLGQMVIRIALQCNEADAYLIMDDDNPAPRLLSRPGEAIYNDTSGALEGNSPFQVVWLSDQLREDYLRKVSAMVARTSSRSCSSPPERGQPAGSEDSQPWIKVSCSRRKSPLFQAERRILACCSETGAKFVFIIMRVAHLISRLRLESLNFFGTSSHLVPKYKALHNFLKKA